MSDVEFPEEAVILHGKVYTRVLRKYAGVDAVGCRFGWVGVKHVTNFKTVAQYIGWMKHTGQKYVGAVELTDIERAVLGLDASWTVYQFDFRGNHHYVAATKVLPKSTVSVLERRANLPNYR